MSIAVNNITSSTKDRIASPGTSHSFSHTTNVGVDTVLFLFVGTLSNSGAVQSNYSATYNGVSMTKIGESLRQFAGIAMFYLVNPATGSNTVAVTWAGSSGGLFVARSLDFVKVSAPVRPGSWTTAQGTSATPSISIPTDTTDWILGGLVNYQLGVATPTGGQNVTHFIANYVYHYDYISPSSSPKTASWTQTSQNYTTAGFSIQEADMPVIIFFV